MEGQGRTYMGSSLKYSYDTSKEDEAGGAPVVSVIVNYITAWEKFVQ